MRDPDDRTTIIETCTRMAWHADHREFDATQHLVTNHLVTVDGDAAVCTAGFLATHRLANPLASPLWTLGGTWRLDLRRTGAGWRIRGVVMTAVWADSNKDLLALAAGR